MITIDFKGIEETKNNLIQISKNIKQGTDDTMRQVAELGYQYAMNLAPEYTGALKEGILVFPENEETWIIVSKQPEGDIIPINIWFDEGTYANPRRNSSLGYMKQTEEYLKTEFNRELNLVITRSIE
jgi:hypothetical protein